MFTPSHNIVQCGSHAAGCRVAFVMGLVMAGALARNFYGSPAWKQTRRAYLKSVGGLCERCMANGIVKPAEVVHHINPITEKNVGNVNVTLSWNNLQALCAGCHADVHDDLYRKRTGRRYKINNLGRVEIIDE